MTKFLVLYRSTMSAQDMMANSTPEERTESMNAWMAWGQEIGSALVDWGSPLGDSLTINGDPSPDFLGGYSVVQAESSDAAHALFDGHPHMAFPDNSIDLIEILPMPGM